MTTAVSFQHLMFASKATINAAPAAERDAYYEWVERFCASPEEYGFTAKPDHQKEMRDDAMDRGIHRANGDVF